MSTRRRIATSLALALAGLVLGPGLAGAQGSRAALGDLGTLGPRKASQLVTVTNSVPRTQVGQGVCGNLLVPKMAIDSLVRPPGTALDISAGQVLVVTSLAYESTAALQAHDLAIVTAQGPIVPFRLVPRPQEDGSGQYGAAVSSLGFVVRRGETICFDASSGVTDGTQVWLYGFLSPDE